MKLIRLISVFILSFTLSIQPLLAEDLMVASSNSDYESIELQDLLVAEHIHLHNAMQHSVEHDNDHMHSMSSHASNHASSCCDDGVHICQMLDCDAGQCNLVHLSSVTIIPAVQLINTSAVSYSMLTDKSTLFSRTISPELRPPLA